MENHQRLFILNMLAYLVQRDTSIQQACHIAGIDLAELKKNEKITFTQQQLEDLWRAATRLTNDALLGLHFGEAMQLAALGAVGEIIKSSDTVGEAITHAAALTPLVTHLFRMEITQETNTFTISFIPYPAKADEQSIAFRQMMDFFIVFVIHELDGLLLKKINPQSVRLPYTIYNLQEYERVFRCTPVKRKGAYSITFEGKLWNEPILTGNYELQSLLLQKVNMIRSENQETQTLQTRIYNYLVARSYLGIVSLEEMAANFNMTPRTLQRKLKEEGVKYQHLADMVRKTLALHYLESGNYQVKEIAYMLGYNELSAFTRAFKRWTGISPTLYFPKPVVTGIHP
jgi:AraC-like DNA-binding protein